jgi:hypothetical protein
MRIMISFNFKKTPEPEVLGFRTFSKKLELEEVL